MKTKQYKVSIIKMIEVDHYENGCDPSSTQDLGEVFKFQSSDLGLVRDRIESYTNVELSKCELFESRLEYSTLETDEGALPNDHQLQLFKNNKIKLWHSTYSIYLESVETTELDALLLIKGDLK